MNLGRFKTLVRREFQEHRMLWVGPLIAAALVLVGVALMRKIQAQGTAFDAAAPLDARGHLWVSGFALLSTFSFVGLIAGALAAFYALDCLYAERKDRSILFWKSLPVSDAETVLSKYAVAGLVLPVAMLLLTLLVQPLMALVLYARFEPLRPYFSVDLLTAWISLVPYLFAVTAFSILWYAPLVAWLLLASVAMRRAPLALAALPILAVPVERWVFGTSQIGRFLIGRVFPWPERLPAPLTPYIQRSDPALEWWRLFMEPGLWIGLAVAAGMLYVVIRLRRYRDDT
jgi:ABC-2 type transport system permease protein